MAFVTELLGYIGLDVDDASFNEAEQSVKDVTKVMAGLVTIAASVATAVTGAAYAMVSSYAESAAQIERTSQRLNINAESFQALTYAAKRFGVEQDQLSDGMKELSMRAAEFASTGEGSAKDALAQLGISQRQVKAYGNDVNGLFNIIRDRISEIKDQGQRQYLSDALFGGGLADVGGEFFSQTAASIAELKKQAMDIGYIIPESELKKADEFNTSVMLASDSIKGLWNIVARNLIPIFKEMTDRFNEFIKLHGADIVDGLTTAINGLITAIKYLGVAAAIAMPYLIGSAAIASWAKLIALTNSLTGSFLAMRTGALLAWAAAAAGPVLVGIAIGALILAIQDVYTYFTGGDSITGRIIDGLGKPVVDKIKQAWTDLKAWFNEWVHDVGKWFTDLIPDWLKNPAIQGRQQMIESGQGDPNSKQSKFAYPVPAAPGMVAQHVLVPPRTSVTAPPTAAQSYAAGMAQANGVTSPVVHNTTTVGEIVINDSHDPQRTAQAVRDELRKTNASTVKGVDTGVKY